MKSLFSKLKRDNTPSIFSLRKKLYNTEKLWFLTLVTFCVILIATGVIGFKLFYSVYYETYKNETSAEENKDPININNLKGAIKRRAEFQNATTTLPADPSI